MGYTTDFSGSFTLDRKLDEETHKFLTKFNETRRMARNVDPKYGEEGEFYVDGDGFKGQGDGGGVIDHNRPPKTQPGLWCQWRPNEDGTEIEWDGGEKFYEYVAWIEYLIDKILKPRGYVLNGEVRWQGEDDNDRGTIVITDNVVETDEDGDHEAALQLILEQKKVLPALIGLTPWLDKEIAKRLQKKEG